MALPTVSEWRTKLDELEQQILDGDGHAIIARWHSGRWLAGLRRHKQLPKGTLEMLMYDYKVSRSELTARMKFATKFRTEEQVTTVISNFRTWFNIKQKALTDTPREKTAKPQLSLLRRAFALLEEFEPSGFDADDVFMLDVMTSCVRGYQKKIEALKSRRLVAHVGISDVVHAVGEM